MPPQESPLTRGGFINNDDLRTCSVMHYSEIKPCTALQQMVRYFWVIEQKCALVEEARYRLFAESSPNIVFFHGSGESILAGHTVAPRDMMIREKFLMVGVCLYPYAVPLMFRLPALELTHKAFDFDLVVGKEATFLRERVMEVSSIQEKIETVSAYLLKKTKTAAFMERSIQGSVLNVIQKEGQLTVENIVQQAGISSRQAERKFREYAGMSPKLFTRLIRFHASLQWAGANCSLTEIAYRSGYFDQSHFIREFKQFSGISPKQYFRLNPSQVADNFIQLSG
jgi:AraC-like DNA-binding protein